MRFSGWMIVLEKKPVKHKRSLQLTSEYPIKLFWYILQFEDVNISKVTELLKKKIIVSLKMSDKWEQQQ